MAIGRCADAIARSCHGDGAAPSNYRIIHQNAIVADTATRATPALNVYRVEKITTHRRSIYDGNTMLEAGSIVAPFSLYGHIAISSHTQDTIINLNAFEIAHGWNSLKVGLYGDIPVIGLDTCRRAIIVQWFGLL